MAKKNVVKVYCTDEQFEKISERAEINCMSLSEFMLFCTSNARIDIRVGVDPATTKIVLIKGYLDGGLISRDEFEALKARIFKDEMILSDINRISEATRRSEAFIRGEEK